jgi:putative aldouronate transport system substrate-binding protein
VDGVYTYDPENPNYEVMLTEMAKLYADGIFNPEFVTTDGQALNTLGASNKLGSAISYAEHAKNYTISCQEIDEDALFSCVVPIVGPTGTQLIPARNKVESDTYITAAAVESGKVEQILSFFDYIYSPEGIELTNYGIEGTNFEYVDGTPTLLAPYNESFTTARSNGLIPSPIPFCFTNDVYMDILVSGSSYDELEPSGQSFVDGLTINNDYYYTEPPLIKTEAYVEYFDLLEQQTALRDKCIMGQITLDEYREQYEALKAAGLSEVIEESKEAYDNIK